MVTIKKRGPNLSSLLLIFSLFLTIILCGCGPAGPRAVIKGEKLLRKGDYPAAVEKLEEATRLLAKDPAPVQAQAWNFLGLAYQNAGQPDKSYKAYLQSLKLDRNLVEADYNLGVLLLEQKNYAAALDPLTTYCTLRPQDPEGFTKLGTAHLRASAKASPTEKQRKLDNAKKCFETARNLQPSPEIDNALGVVYLQRNRPTDAQKEFNSALKQDPQYAPAILNLAIIAHEYQRDHKLALQKYREYLAVKPTPDNAAEIQAVVKNLEREFAPPPVAASPAPKPAEAPAPVISAAPVAPKPVQVANPPTKTNAAPTVQTPAPKPAAPVALASPKQTADTVARPAPAPAPAPKPVVTPAPVEVAQVTESATPKPAQDITTTAPQPALAPVTTAAPRPVALQPLEPKPEKKTTLLKKLNPVTWFSKKDKTKEAPAPAAEVIKETPLPESKPAVATAAPSVATPPPSRPAIARYKYLSPAKPNSGNADSAAKFVEQGNNARRSARYEDAILAYRNALLSDPANFDAAYQLSLTEQDNSDFQSSLQHFELALAIKPDSSAARYAFAWSFYKSQYSQDAANELEKLLQQSPNDVKANLLLATIYAQNLSQPKLARDHYRRVLEADPHHPQATAIRFWLAANP
jgi:tetratricopeptide (TPR) repeat protein